MFLLLVKSFLSLLYNYFITCTCITFLCFHSYNVFLSFTGITRLTCCTIQTDLSIDIIITLGTYREPRAIARPGNLFRAVIGHLVNPMLFTIINTFHISPFFSPNSSQMKLFEQSLMRMNQLLFATEMDDLRTENDHRKVLLSCPNLSNTLGSRRQHHLIASFSRLGYQQSSPYYIYARSYLNHMLPSPQNPKYRPPSGLSIKTPVYRNLSVLFITARMVCVCLSVHSGIYLANGI